MEIDMMHRFLVVGGALAVLGAIPVTAQAPAPKPAPAKTTKPWTAPRTPDGHSDLQGIWSYVTATPLEKPGGAGAYIYAREDRENPVGGYNTLFYDTIPRGVKDRPVS
jgi:hypothetical protein